MKFITEDDLRILFRKEPFVSYELQKETRLTPGARQFLMDKKVSLCEEMEVGTQKRKKPEQGKTEAKTEVKTKGNGTDYFLLKRTSIQAHFLEVGITLLDQDVLLAEQIFLLERALSFVGKENAPLEKGWESCAGFTKENCRQSCEDCFEITGFHAQSEKGRILVPLHRLRCSVRELAAEREDGNLNRILNRLSQLICQQYGGKTCQKKN
ncbi:hypothetical protein [Clostridium sp. E02]|uniref:hypothetical protein n=1 Tax=Clostridium sp. E02 TaxID=2487134 RepID=UPI000F525117|nr:hypothetical protein [Clostridium sp. E02]